MFRCGMPNLVRDMTSRDGEQFTSLITDEPEPELDGTASEFCPIVRVPRLKFNLLPGEEAFVRGQREIPYAILPEPEELNEQQIPA